MSVWSVYKKSDGHFTGRKITTANEALLQQNLNEGEKALAGSYDHLSQMVDDEGEVTDYQPPQPSADHEWIAGIKRWHLKPEIVARHRDIANAQTEIDSLERSQLRAIRELALDGKNADAQARLKSIDKQIAIQRAVITVNQSS